MKYTGIKCEYCGSEFTDEDDVVVCPECGTPQHRNCWMQNNRCVNAARHGEENFAWVMPDWKRSDNQPEKTGTAKPRTDADELAEKIRFKNNESVIICPDCGAMNYGNDAFCIKCHKPLHKSVEQMYKMEDNAGQQDSNQEGSTPGNEYNYSQNPSFGQQRDYSYFNTYGGIAPDVEIDGIPVNELSTYIGGARPGRFIRRFMMMERSGRKFSANPVVIIFGPVWYFYRKMIKQGIIFLAISLCCILIMNFAEMTPAVKEFYQDMYSSMMSGEFTSVADIQNYIQEKAADLQNEEMPVANEILYYAGLGGLVANYAAELFFADYFYRKKIKKDVEKIRARNDNMPAYLADLSHSGGASPVIGLIGVLALIAGYYIMSFIVLFAALSL